MKAQSAKRDMDHKLHNSQLQPSTRLSPPTTPKTGKRTSRLIASPNKPLRLSERSEPTLEAILADNDLTKSQKDLALRVSRASNKLREWHAELETWQWNGSFQKRDTALMSLQQISHPLSEYLSLEDDSAVIENCTSFNPSQLRDYEARLDDIHDEFSILELNYLKEYVLDIHTSKSRPASRDSTFTTSGLTFLDDFSFFITQTLVRALPILSCLTPELQTWSIRLQVFRRIPHFLHRYSKAKTQMVMAWTTLDDVKSNVDSVPIQSRLDDVKAQCHMRISAAADVLDSLLDLLEGHVDTLPEGWIDAFEDLEADFGNWCASAHSSQYLEAQSCSHASSSIGHEKTENNGRQMEEVSTGAVHPHLATPALASDPDKLNEIKEARLTKGEAQVSTKEHTSAVDAKINNMMSTCTAEELADSRDESLTRTGSSQLSADSRAADVNTAGESMAENARDTAAKMTSIVRDEIEDTRSVKALAITVQEVSKRLSDSSEHSTEFSEQSLLGNSIFSESALADTTDVTNVLDVSDIDEHAQSGQRPHTPDFGYCSDDETFYEGLLTSLISEFDDDDILSEAEESPLRRKQPISMAPKPPLNALMKKRAHRVETGVAKIPKAQQNLLQSDIQSSSTNESVSTANSLASSTSLELQISNILEAIPTHIRLQSGPKANSPEIRRNRTCTSSIEHDRRANVASRASTPSLTLAPAEESSRKKASGGSEIRLYHLIQAGQDKPIKLFIRRVGENGERVMVRVGGGWADLGEYLRIYAEHHGRRTTSDGRIEVQAIQGPKTGITPRRSDSRQSSLLGKASRSSTPAFGRSSTPTFNDRASKTAVTATAASTQTPEIATETPKSLASNDSRKTSGWNEVGLSGPRARRGDSSSEKKEWVDGIVEQAKRDLGQHVQVGDLGKSGSTRRIFFKGRKSSGNP